MALSKQFHDSAIHESMKESTLYWTISRFCRCCPCFGSSVVFAPNDTIGQSKTNIIQLKRLGLTDFELQSFYDVFSQLDDDESGTIDHYEFSDAIGSTTDIIQGDAKLNDALFGTFDLDHGKQSEGLDFSEFVITIWNYATYSETELARFAFFNLCECDRTGTLSYDQVKHFLKSYASHSGGLENATSIQKDLLAMDTNGDHMIDLNEWMKFTNTHKRIMVPLIKAQSNLKQRVMGRLYSNSFEPITQLPIEHLLTFSFAYLFNY